MRMLYGIKNIVIHLQWVALTFRVSLFQNSQLRTGTGKFLPLTVYDRLQVGVGAIVRDNSEGRDSS
jgi:hypothetical protein